MCRLTKKKTSKLHMTGLLCFDRQMTDGSPHKGPVMRKACPWRRHVFCIVKTVYWYWMGSWWRHQKETFSALLAIFAGNSPVNSPHKGQWRGALKFSLICARINGWVNNGEAGDLRHHRAHYDVIVMIMWFSSWSQWKSKSSWHLGIGRIPSCWSMMTKTSCEHLCAIQSY